LISVTVIAVLKTVSTFLCTQILPDIFMKCNSSWH
jgi:hypothetical protein